MHEETTWPTNKYSLAFKLIICKGKGLQKARIFHAEIAKFEIPINAQQQINTKLAGILLRTTSITTSEHYKRS